MYHTCTHNCLKHFILLYGLNNDLDQNSSWSDSNLTYIMQYIIYLHPDLEFCCELGCGIWYSALCYSPLYLDCSYFSVIIKTLKWIQLICYLSGTSLERLDNNRTQVRTFSLVTLLDKMTKNTLSVSCVHGDVINNDSSVSPSLSIHSLYSTNDLQADWLQSK